VSEGGEDKDGRFHHIQSFDDGLIAEFFSREVFALLLREELISQALMEKIMGWRHSGFNVHSRVRALTKKEAERVGKYMIRPLLALERLSFDEKEGKVSYRYGEEGEEDMILSLLGGEVWVISGSFGVSRSFKIASPRSQVVLDTFWSPDL
jgi:hypothetical protein